VVYVIEEGSAMSTVRRVYVEKKKEFAVNANALRHEIKHQLEVTGVKNVRLLVRYDV
jgi:phosphoribosylformylglycinamidine synthase